MKLATILFAIVITAFSNSLASNPPLWNAWEIGVKAMNNSVAISVPVKAYTFNTSSRNLEEAASGFTFSGQGFPNNDANGWADIGDDNSDNAMFHLPYGNLYYIRIESKYMILSF